ncbi:MAG TPA: hypothetical protein ENK85_10375 [Saprospiraceae bacterium]|nr:hypothetical protein [Saprospiraceae bacterium]
MKNVSYYVTKIVVVVILFFTFRKRNLINKNRIPKKDPVIFLPNHQNALVDAIMIAPLIKRQVHFMTRADVFKNPLIGRYLRSINMFPIYRLRDGRDQLAKNAEIIEQCADLLLEGGVLQIFPEGNHHTDRRVRNFKNGFIEIAFLALDKNPNLPLKLIPTGLNYDSRQRFSAQVNIIFGEPINVREYYDPAHPKESMSRLNAAVSAQVKTLTTHIEPKEDYKEIHDHLVAKGIDFLDPAAANELVKSKQFSGSKGPRRKKTLWGLFIYYLFLVLNIVPLSLWWSRKKKIKDPAFIYTMRLVFIGVVFPLFYLLVGWAIAHFWGPIYCLAYLGFSIFLGFLRKRLPYWY